MQDEKNMAEPTLLYLLKEWWVLLAFIFTSVVGYIVGRERVTYQLVDLDKRITRLEAAQTRAASSLHSHDLTLAEIRVHLTTVNQTMLTTNETLRELRETLKGKVDK